MSVVKLGRCVSLGEKYVLEGVQLVLPSPVELQTHLDAAENHLLTALEVDAQLDNIAIIDGEGLALLRGRAQADMVEERAGGAFNILDVPFAILVPKLAVSATDDLALEADRGGGGLVARQVGHGVAVSLGVATDTDLFRAGGQSPGDGREGE